MTENNNTLEARVLPVLVWPDDGLHICGEDVTNFDSSLHQVVINMFATMKANDGIGLAAPQVGIHLNIITVWIEHDAPMTFVNPVVVETGDEMFKWEEGCLSVPGYFEDRERPSFVVVRYNDVNGVEHEVEFRDLYAFAIQHEIDHLNGKVFVDNASKLKQLLIKNKIRKTTNKRNK